jgi:hypothetical protein
MSNVRPQSSRRFLRHEEARMQRSPSRIHFAARAGITIGLVLWVCAGLLAAWRLAWLSRTVRAQGEIVQIQQEPGHTGYRTIVRYTTGEGPVRYVITPVLSPRFGTVGETVNVAYSRADPSNAQIVALRTLWLLPTTLSIMGVPSLLMGIWYTVRQRLRRAGCSTLRRNVA